MKDALSGVNVARFVGLLWDNSDSSSDCMTNEPPYYFKESCFDDLDFALQQAVDAGIWVILTDRSQIAAGQYYQTDPMLDVFNNETLRYILIYRVYCTKN